MLASPDPSEDDDVRWPVGPDRERPIRPLDVTDLHVAVVDGRPHLDRDVLDGEDPHRADGGERPR